MFFPSRWSQLRYVRDICVELGLPPSRIPTGIYRRGSLQKQCRYSGHIGNNARRAPATTDAYRPHRPAVGVDTTLLGPGSSLTPGTGRMLVGDHRAEARVDLSLVLSDAHRP
jgi:hypothetical protein